MLKRRKITFINVTGSFATLVIAAIFSVAPAYAAGAPMCTSQGSGLCMSDEGNTYNGAPVKMETRNYNDNQDIQYPTVTSACNNGKVSSANSCPFTPGSGLNAAYDGDSIVTLKFANQGVCVVDASNGWGTGYVGPCSGVNGVNWVAVPEGGGHWFINVYSSNHMVNGVQAACLVSQGSLHSLVAVQPITQGCNNWAHP